MDQKNTTDSIAKTVSIAPISATGASTKISIFVERSQKTSKEESDSEPDSADFEDWQEEEWTAEWRTDDRSPRG